MESVPIVVDNGSYSIKFGMASSDEPQLPYTAINAMARDKYDRPYLSNQIKRIKDISSVTFKRPHEWGQLTSWELESGIWDYCFFNPDDFNGFGLKDTGGHHLVASETCMTIPELSKNMDQVIFEEYEFASLLKSPVAGFMPFASLTKGINVISGKGQGAELPKEDLKDELNKEGYKDFSLAIDSGYNCTWIVPVIKGIPYYKGVKKLDIGGRFLTGLLKETLSFRHYDVMDETLLVDNIKEKCLFMSPSSYFNSFQKRRDTAVEYVLPDFQTTFLGYIHEKREQPIPEGAQSIELTDELFSVPETFFHPEMAKLLKPGIIEVILESLSMLPEAMRPLMVNNIICTGGNFNIPNFASRLATELQRQLPTDWTCRVISPQTQSELYGWRAMTDFTNNNTELYKKARVTREEYYEHGADWCTKNRFGFQNWI